MNTPSNAVPESQVVWPAMARAMFSSTRPFLWSLRRELWEYRAIYLVPLGAAAVFTIGFLINIINVRRKIRTVAWQMPHASTPYEISAALIMGTALLVGLYYALDTLYGERRDRSILFWKSLPVSDLTAVLSKFTVVIVIVPLFSLAVTMV
ncbi:MAG: ABC transporter permease, partial [Candidatus Angelobacter sp.]